jgi:hypothetical protein
MNIEDWCDKEGVKHEFSATYNPQQNRVVECKNKTLITLARAMLDDYDTLERFWAEDINTACHATNRVYLHRLLEKTPYDLLVGRKPNISYFRVFGCKYFIYKKKRLGKFKSRCDEGLFLGYASNSKAYRVFNKTSGQDEETCDAEFDESNGSQGEVVGYDHVGDEEVQEALKNTSIGDIKPQVREASTSSTTHSINPNVDKEEDKKVPPIHPRVQVPSTQVQDQVDPIVQSSSQVQDNRVQSPQAPQDVPEVRHGWISKDHPIDQIIGSHLKGVSTRSKRQASFVEDYSFVSFVKPMCVEKALKDLDCLLAMQEELNNFTRNDVWVLEPPLKSKNIIGIKWVFRNKEDEHGVVVRNKARLVVKGYSQVEGLDFGETFTPVARLEAIRLLLAYSSFNDIKLYQMDVKSAFS